MKKILLALILLAYSFVIFQKGFYYFFQPFLGTGWAYVTDQSLPLLIVLFFAAFFGLYARNLDSAWDKIRSNGYNLLTILFVIFIVHGLLLSYYFEAEDVTFILSPVNNNQLGFPFHFIINGYPFMPFVLSFLQFKTNAVYYNIVSIILFTFSAICLYWLIYELSQKKVLALFASLFFVTTPSYLDMFSWQASVQGMSVSLALNFLTCIFLIKLLRKYEVKYFILSSLLFIASVKVGFVRGAGMLIVFFFITALFNIKDGIKRLPTFFYNRVLLLFIFAFTWINFVLVRFNPSLFLTPFRAKTTGAAAAKVGYFPALTYYVSHLFFPTDVARYVFGDLVFTGQNRIFFIGLLLLALLFLIGTISLSVFVTKKSTYSFIFLLAVVFVLANLFYIPFFTLGPNTDVGKFDMLFIRNEPPYGPGSRYVFFAAVGISILFGFFAYVVFALKRNILKLPLIILIFLLLIGSSFISIFGHERIVRKSSTPYRNFFDKVFALVPFDNKPKLLFSSNPKKNALDHEVGGGDWLYGFYKKDELTYVNNWDKLHSLIKQKNYQKENIYAFYNNPDTYAFADISEQVKDKLFSNKVEEVKDLISFFLKISSSSQFSNISGTNISIQTRPILETHDINERITRERNLYLDLSITNKKEVPFPFYDAVFMEENQIAPAGIWNIIPDSPNKFKSKSSFSTMFLKENSASYVFSILYACAENSEWMQQKQEKVKLLKGIWNLHEVKVEQFVGAQLFVIPVDCKGTKLRKIIIIGGAIPADLKLEKAILR